MTNFRDHVTIQDQEGNVKTFAVEALFDMGEKSYALLRNKNETLLMRVEGKELVGLASEEEKNDILDAYEIAVDAVPAEFVDRE